MTNETSKEFLINHSDDDSNSEARTRFFFAAGVVPDPEMSQYETILHFARAGNHIRSWGAPFYTFLLLYFFIYGFLSPDKI